MSLDLHHWYSEKNDSHNLYGYMGELNEVLVTEILEQMELNLIQKCSDVKRVRKVYNVFVECLQNLYHHGEVPPEYAHLKGKFGAIFLRSQGIGYRICTGNFIRCDGIKYIRDRIDQVNCLTEEDKRSLYRLILSNNRFSDKGGGGLGFVDIARKTGNKMEYQFLEYNEEYIFLLLDVVIS